MIYIKYRIDCNICATSPYVDVEVNANFIPQADFYPCKGAKKAQREEGELGWINDSLIDINTPVVCTVYIIERNKNDAKNMDLNSNTISEYLLVRRPNHGK
jgi:hypothetical protein